ncbi:MAG TPA: PQQ-binding-like beta-propeller repeat protein [Polyangiales bacterium]|nr:PQQ-binding-like beta-propeller repeat protein [Polyangiales bacterium]
MPGVTPRGMMGAPGDVTNPGTSTSTAGGPAMATAGGGAPAGAAGGGAPNVPVGDATVDWTMMGYDPGSTYFNKAEKTITKDNAASLQVIWEKDLGGNVLGGALQVGDKMYASGPGAVFALDAATGNELWKVSAASSSTLGYANDTLYLHSTSGNVMAFKAADGSMLWSMKADASGSDGSSSAIPVGGLVLVGGSSGTAELGGGMYRGYMSALDMMSGANKWTTFTVPQGSIGASFWSTASASMADGLVFGGTGNNYAPPATDTSDSIIAFDFNTGEIKWKFQRVMDDTFPANFSAPDSDFGNNPVVIDVMIGGAMEKVVAGGTKYGYIVVLKRATGDLIWKRDICKMGSADGDNGLFTNFSFSGKGFVGACNEAGPATLVSLDPATGDMQWSRSLPGRVFGRMAFANGVGFVGTGEAVEAFDVDTGTMIKSFPSKAGTVASTITISRGRVTFGDGIAWLPAGLKAGSTLTVLGLK